MGGDMILLATMGITGAASLIFSLFMVKAEFWQSTGACTVSEAETRKGSC